MHLARGFSDIGYHKLIGLKGEIWDGRPLWSVGAHVKGFNNSTIGVCYVGGLDSKTALPKDTRTEAQTESLIKVCKDLLLRYPNAVILGHRDFSPDLNGDGTIQPMEFFKLCPCFDAGPWAKSLGLPGAKLVKGKDYVRL
jgi:N-acetyl-anhydromuramyl-L-alanine amidase AmpD